MGGLSALVDVDFAAAGKLPLAPNLSSSKSYCDPALSS